MANFDICNASYNNLDDPNKAKDVNSNLFNMITRINKSELI